MVWLGHMAEYFSYFGNLYIDFHNESAIYTLPTLDKGSFFLSSSPAFVFMIIDILTGVRQILKVNLICMTLMVNDVEHF